MEPRRLIWRHCFFHKFISFTTYDEQAIQVLVISSFGPFGEILGMPFFEFLKALFPQTSFAVVDQIPIVVAPATIGYLGEKIVQQQYWELTII